MSLFRALRPLIHVLPPEVAHELALEALRLGLVSFHGRHHEALAVSAMGLSFLSPLGLAAGFDKDASAIGGLLRAGFGFVEAGTVTLKAQKGNPIPRLFRLPEDEAVINRLGFNNAGLKAFVERFKRRRAGDGIVGANIGKNKESEDAAADYVACLQAVYPYADYITINISSPNTPGLRALQKRAALEELLAVLSGAREISASQHGRRVPLLLKVAPDLEAREKEDIVDKAVEFAIDGLIVSNTTVSRPGTLKSRYAAEEGGLSGRPLFDLSTSVLKDFYKLTGGRMALIGAGGIFSAEDAYQKIRSGATLVQLYTALVYKGFGVVREIENGLVDLLKRDGFTHISDAVGVDVKYSA